VTTAGGRQPGEPVRAPGGAGSRGPAGAGRSAGSRGPAGAGGSRGPGAAPSARLALLQRGAVWGAFIGLGVLGGYLLDRVAGTSPLLTFVGLALGILGAAAGSYRVIRPYLTDASSRAAKTKD
jgi:hypothetical protein